MRRSLTRRVTARLMEGQRRLGRLVERLTHPAFASPADGFVMRLPRTIEGARYMSIGEDVKLGANSVLKCQTRYPGGWLQHPDGDHVHQTFTPRLTIGDRVTATAGLRVTVFDSVTIEDDVMFASNVYLADGGHVTERADVPYKYQGMSFAPVRVGRGAWVGQNVVINPGVTIGAQAIIGANSVVTRDVPPRCVAAGAPARVVRRWDEGAGGWIRVGVEGGVGA